MLDHLSLGVTDLARSMAFYDAALGTLGYVRVWTREHAAGYGPPGGEDRLALFATPEVVPSPKMHLAVTSPTEAQVHSFHLAAIASGGLDDGPPGPRPQYGPGYVAAFVRDPDGHRLEAVFHATVP